MSNLENNMNAVKGYKGLYITNNGIYKIRIAVPEKVQKFYDLPKEFNQSLRTKDFNEAKTKYYEIMQQLERKFNLNNKIKASANRPLCPDKIFETELLKTIHHFFTEYSGKTQNNFLKQIIDNSLTPRHLNNGEKNPEVWIIEEAKQQIRDLDMKWIHSFKSEIDTGITSQTTQNMITYLTNSQYNLTPEQTYKAKTALAQTIIEAANFHIETEIDYSSTPENYIFKYDIVNQAYTQYTLKKTYHRPLSIQRPISSPNNKDDILSKIKDTSNKPTKIKELLTLWQTDCGDSIKEKIHHIQSFIDCFPEKETLNEVASTDILSWIEILKMTPAHINRKKEFNGLSMSDIITKNQILNYPCLTPKTINTYINSFSSLHKWAKKKRYISSENPTKETLFNKQDIISPIPKTYSSSEIRQIIDYFNRHKTENLDLYWAVMIAIYTGMREGEVCQLRTKDIRSRDNIQYFSVNNEAEKTIKNNHSIRMIPIHNKLIQLGINDFINERNQQNEEKLFPSFKIYQRGKRKDFNKCFSQPFANILIKLNLKKENRLVHSLRHTFVDSLRISGLSDEEIQFLVGHEKQIMTNQYGQLTPQSPLKILQKWINMVNYDEETKTGN